MSESGVELSALRGMMRQLRADSGGCRLGLFEVEPDQGALAVARDLAHDCALAREAVLLVGLRRETEPDPLADGLPLGAARDGRLRNASFIAGEDAANLEMRQIGSAKAYVIRPRMTGDVAIAATAGFWTNAAEMAAVTLVTAPPLLDSDAGLAVARHLDGVVLTVSARAGSVRSALHAVQALTRARANLLGLIYTDADLTLAKLERLWPSWAA